MKNTTTQEDAMSTETYITNHGERVIIVGNAHDPARVRVVPADDHGRPKAGAEYFTPLRANLTPQS